MTAGARRDWRVVILLIGSAGGAVLAFSIVLAILAYAAGASALGSPQAVNEPDALQAMVLVASLALVGALSLPAVYNSVRSLRGKAVVAGGPRRLGIWQALILVVAWLGACLLGQAVVADGIWKWTAPAFHALAIGAPVYLWVRLAAGGLGSGSPTRYWGLFVTGMWLTTGLAFLAEVSLAFVALLAAGVYVMLNPAQLPTFQTLAHQLSGVAGLSDALTVLGPLLDRPWVFFAALLVFAGITPVIEEGAKSIAIWTVIDRLGRPGEGFLAGALTGAGFGLVESLLASASPDPYWAVALAIRGGSSVMHIAAAAAAGYGIVAFYRTRHIASLLGGYLAAIMIHGLWNASVIIMGFGALHVSMGLNATNYMGLFLVAFGASILVALCTGTPIALMAANRRLRSVAGLSQPQSGLEPALAASPTIPPAGVER